MKSKTMLLLYGSMTQTLRYEPLTIHISSTNVLKDETADVYRTIEFNSVFYVFLGQHFIGTNAKGDGRSYGRDMGK